MKEKNIMLMVFTFSLYLLTFTKVVKANIDVFSTNELEPTDYLFGSGGDLGDPVFDRYRTIDLNVDIGIGSDCGRINLKNTLRAALRNILDTKYLGAIGRDILASSPMLLTCYFSPTWCAILKNARLRANFLAQLRLNQCKAINRFVDGRVSDYYEERSNCIQRAIKSSNGNFEEAMNSCKNYQDFNIRDWAGDGKSPSNKLIESTAKWAGMTGGKAQQVVNLTKAFIGDTVIKRGEVSIDFGPRRVQLTPRTYLMEIKSTTHKKLCKQLLPKLLRKGGYKSNVYRVIRKDELEDVSGSSKIKLDHQTLLSLAYMPYKKRQIACRKLSDALAMGTYTEDMGQTLDFISSKLTNNPHLPEKRKKEAELKRRAFKDHVELTLSLEKQNHEPINKVLYQINKEGQKYVSKASKREMDNDRESLHTQRIQQIFFDGADGIGN